MDISQISRKEKQSGPGKSFVGWDVMLLIVDCVVYWILLLAFRPD